MTEFKPGDRLWVLMEIAPDYVPDVDVLSGGAVIETVIPGTSDSWTEAVESAIPDVPHLPAIARYLAEHPETVEFIATAISVVDAYDTTPYQEMQTNVMVAAIDWNAIDCGISDGMRKRLHGFLRAMRGEAE